MLRSSGLVVVFSVTNSSSVLPIPYLLGRIDDLNFFIPVLLVTLLLTLLLILAWPILLLGARVSCHVIRQ